MTRVLRYPRMCALSCAGVMLLALARDACIAKGLSGWAHVLLVATSVTLLLSLILMSCRFLVDHEGVGVGFLLRMRRVRWADVASFGLLTCNSRRPYFYGMYRGATDFINLLHRAPQCGDWGFVVPVSRKLLRAVCECCPFELDLSASPKKASAARLRWQPRQLLISFLTMLPAAVAAISMGTLMLVQAAGLSRADIAAGATLCAMALLAMGQTLLYRLTSSVITCPAFDETGVRAGQYLPWADVRFGYVHRIAKMSGLFLLSQPLDAVHKRGAPPIDCLSMPDTQTVLIAYLMYCPHADKGMQE